MWDGKSPHPPPKLSCPHRSGFGRALPATPPLDREVGASFYLPIVFAPGGSSLFILSTTLFLLSGHMTVAKGHDVAASTMALFRRSSMVLLHGVAVFCLSF
ncbi:hypothetical protein CRG98_011692 [Punica granatum]|uniref:Uncharacterized protein n=1 Tax=Punica granatum TaxID=22663 RepID=A0A2I0KJX4_PUNGR|nr:hypothetical protein CRG98_011692 [Punica granatum]